MNAADSTTTTRLRFGNDQFREWQEDFCDRQWAVDTDRDRRLPFGVDLEIRDVGRARLNSAAFLGGGTSIARTSGRVAADHSIGVALTVVEQGHSTLIVDGQEYPLAAGDVSLLDGAVTFDKRLQSQHYREHLLLVPAAVVTQLLGAPFDRRGPVVAPRHGLAPLIGDFVKSLAARDPVGRPAELDTVLKSVLLLVGEVFQGRRAEADDSREWQRTRISRYIDAHLDGPELTPRSIAENNRISLRYLHKLFEGTGETVASTIRARRLERCRADLTSPDLAHLHVRAIAFSWGFEDAAHFSRAFKARYGMTPREAREAGQPPPGS